MPLRPFFVAAVLATCTAGCMKNRPQRLARFEPAAPRPVERPAPAASHYRVKYADVRGGEMKTVRGSRRAVGRGEPLGFRVADDGTLVAVAGDETFPLSVPADRVRFCVWYRRREEPRQFVKEVHKAARTAAEFTGYAAGKVLEAGVKAALHVEDGDDDDDCDDEAGPWTWGGGGDGHRHRGHHHGGGGGGNGSHHGGNKPPKPREDDEPDKPARVGARNP